MSSHGLRMLLSLLIIKAIAVYLGTTGLGELGNFISITSAMAVLAGGGIANGVTTFVAKFTEDRKRLGTFLRAASVYAFSFAGIAFAMSVVFAAPLAQLIFGSANYWWLVPIIGFLQVVGALGVIGVGVANGMRRVDLFGLITIPTYAIMLPIAFVLVSYFGVSGAALSLALSVTATGIPALFVLYRQGFFAIITQTSATAEDYFNLAKYSLMLLASATLFPIAEILLRSHITQEMGLEIAGLWQALTRLSLAYLGFFNVYLATRYMPLLARTHGVEVRKTVFRQLLIAIAAFLALGITLYQFRDVVIWALFSDAFQPLSQALAAQLVGDGFRLASYVIGFLFVARGKSRIYIAAELVQMLLWVILGYIAVALRPDLQSLSISYATAYLIYFSFICGTAYAKRRDL